MNWTKAFKWVSKVRPFGKRQGKESPWKKGFTYEEAEKQWEAGGPGDSAQIYISTSTREAAGRGAQGAHSSFFSNHLGAATVNQTSNQNHRRKRSWEQDWIFGGDMHEDVKISVVVSSSFHFHLSLISLDYSGILLLLVWFLFLICVAKLIF